LGTSALLQLLGTNVRRLRDERGWSQERLATESELDRTYISGVERGVRNPTLAVVARLAEAFAVPAFELLRPTHEPEDSGATLPHD
jgi:transcriptional regulator with XRE-family HTH domain